MAGIILKKIFEYDNYRFFLRDYFHEQKEITTVFSHRYFARKAGFSTSSFCAHVIDGKRKLTEDSIAKIVKGLGLRGRGATYFRLLVLYNQAQTVQERESYFSRLDHLRRSSEFYSVKKEQYAYYDEWYYPVIRELAVNSDWNGDYSCLAALVVPPIQPEKAKKAVETLLSIGMLSRKEDGTFALLHETVTAQDVPPVVTRKTRREFIQLAEEAMEKIPIDARHISGLTVLMSNKKFEQITVLLDELRKSILSESLEDRKKERVFQFNFQAFPLSEDINNGKEYDA
jgi:uncharacterized protein (TIGR02147 family)